MAKKIVTVATLAGAALLVAGGVWFASSRQAAPSAAPSAAGVQAGSTPAAEQVEMYELKYSSRVATATGQLMTSFQLAGPLTLSGERLGKNAVVQAQFKGKLISDAGASGDNALSISALEAAAHRPFQLEFGADGGFQRASGQPGTPAFIGRIWTALGEYLQLTGLNGAQHWEAREHDASGTYVAAYDQREPGHLSKRKLRYETLAAKTLASYDVTSSQAELARDASERLISLSLSEEIRATFAAGGPLPGFQAATKLELIRNDAPVAVTSPAPAPAASVIPFDQMAREQNDAARDEAMIGKLSVDEALNLIRTFEGNDADKAERQRAGEAFTALTALLRRNPEALAKVRAKLMQGGPLTNSLLGALRDASTPETQQLLAELSGPDSPLDADQRLEAARCLSRVASPTKETVQALKTLRSDATVGVQATYGLGSALHQLQGKDDALATGVRETLTAQLASTSDPGSQAAVLTSLGNAGDASTLETIRPYVVSPAPIVRAAAAQALRRIAGPAADALLTQLCGDADPSVRHSAVDAIAERAAAPALLTAVSALAVADTALRVRTKAVNLVAQWYRSERALGPTLQQIASNDSNADLRNVAKLALGRG